MATQPEYREVLPVCVTLKCHYFYNVRSYWSITKAIISDASTYPQSNGGHGTVDVQIHIHVGLTGGGPECDVVPTFSERGVNLRHEKVIGGEDLHRRWIVAWENADDSELEGNGVPSSAPHTCAIVLIGDTVAKSFGGDTFSHCPQSCTGSSLTSWRRYT